MSPVASRTAFLWPAQGLLVPIIGDIVRQLSLRRNVRRSAR
jgi:hypothetical protein